MLPEILTNIGMDHESIIIPDNVYSYILSSFCSKDKGLRTLKLALESIVLRLNIVKLIGTDLTGNLKVNFPLQLTTQIVDSILTAEKGDEVCDMMYM
jgi:hypothetical protein